MSAEIVGNNALTGVAINGLWLKSSNADQLEAAEFQVTNVLRLRHDIRPPKEDDFRVTNEVDLIKTKDSNASVTTGRTQPITLGSGQTDNTIDAGFTKPSRWC